MAIAVHGFRESLYRLTYVLSDNTTYISDGESVTGYVQLRGYQYYRFTQTQPSKVLTVVVTRLYGDPDLVVAIGDYLPTLAVNNGSQLSFGDDVITLDISAYLAGQDYTIGVYGSVNSQYTLVVSQNDTIQLTDGVPQAMSLPPGSPANFRYMTVGASASNVTLQISVSTGSLEFFMNSHAGDSGAYPTGQSYFWTGTATYAAPYQLVITTGDANFLSV